MTVLDALALAYGGDKTAREPLERAYNLSSDLGLVAEVVTSEGLSGVEKFRIKVGRPIRPMLCERLPDPAGILEKVGGEGAAEYKYDGLRVQVHLAEENVHLFSRRLENITDQFPDIAENLRRSIEAKEAIVEGECVAVDSNTGDMLPFQVISQRRGRKYELTRVTEEIPVTAFLFDILFLNGRDLTLLPYLERRNQLLKVTRPSEHVALANQSLVSDPGKLEQLMEEAIAAAKKASELDPLAYRAKNMIAEMDVIIGKEEEGLRIFNELLALNPKNPRSVMNFFEYYLLKGEFSKAEEALNEASKLGQDSMMILLGRGILSASAGRREAAEEALKEILKTDYESVRLNAALHYNTILGNFDEAFKALMRMTETHSWPYLINVAPIYRPLRADPRYAEFLKRVGLSSMIGKV
jgi:tetratricopeptide (TPR) repeat protein